MWIFYFLFWTAVRAIEEPLYKKIGDNVVLRPDSVVNPIISIRWKHGPDIAMEWYRYGGTIFSYQQFKDRGSLDISTGVMTITGLTRDDSGIYTVEINNEVNSQTELLVISAVPKPSISVSWDTEKTHCVFTCDGSTTGTEPVTFWWTADEKRWPSTKEHKITKEEEEQWFSCTLENPVSSSSSEKVFNPFIKEQLYRKIGDKAVLTPDFVENPITRITWKHGPNVAMEWYADKTYSYRQFKDRGSLDISTGVMTITGLTRELSGIYTAEINGKFNKKTQLLVISPVPKPTLYVLCDPERTYCVFTCDGSTTGAEPVTYWWTADDKRWTSTKELKITKEEKKQWFSCIVENPVSSHSSEEVFNIFMEISWTWIYILIPVILVVCIIIIIIIVCLISKYKKERGRKFSAVQNKSNRKETSDVGHDYSKGAGFKPQWQYERESGGWWVFREMTDPPNECSVTSDDVEKWYQENPHDKMPFTVKGDPHELDFKAMIQTNLKTETKRKVRRMMMEPEC